MVTSITLRSIAALACFFGLFSLASPAQADDEEDDREALEEELEEEEGLEEQSYASMAVQNRLHLGTHELSVFFGYLPYDAFTKGVTLGGSYTLHFSDLFAWEIVHFVHSFPVDTSLKEDLAAFELAPTPFEVVENYITTNAVFAPLYWKGAWLNDAIWYGELLLVVGAGYGLFTRSNRPAIDLGIGMRVFTDSLFSIRIDIRHITFFDDSVFSGNSLDLHHEIWAAIGASLSL